MLVRDHYVKQSADWVSLKRLPTVVTHCVRFQISWQLAVRRLLTRQMTDRLAGHVVS